MDVELIGLLEKRVGELLDVHKGLKSELDRLKEENRTLIEERNGIRQRIDAILAKLEGIS